MPQDEGNKILLPTDFSYRPIKYVYFGIHFQLVSNDLKTKMDEAIKKGDDTWS